MKLLQVPTVALEQRIKEELESNPALEEGKTDDGDSRDDYQDDDGYGEISEAEKEFDFSDYMDEDTPSYKLYSKNKGEDDDEKSSPLSVGDTFHELLEAQLGLRILSEQQHNIALHLIGNLDESGYLRRDISSIVDDLAFTQNISTDEKELEELLTIIQEFEPAGVGARDLKECLQIQLARKEQDVTTRTALVILEDYFDEFTKKHYDKILRKLEITEDDLKTALEEILKLNPKPGNSMNDNNKPIEHVVPDFLVYTTGDNELEVSLNSRNAPDLRISRKYSEMLETYSHIKGKPSRSQKDAILFVKQKLDSAKWFIDAIRQRQQTLLLTMKAIAVHQQEYFLEGDETKLKPMILKDIAEKVDLDISTISRVANSKYVQTPYGTFLLKTFFSESLSTDSGEEVSTREVKKILQDLIEGESKKKPLTDDRLAALLKEKGYNIARRTVAKYREQLNIPVARLRKEL